MCCHSNRWLLLMALSPPHCGAGVWRRRNGLTRSPPSSEDVGGLALSLAAGRHPTPPTALSSSSGIQGRSVQHPLGSPSWCRFQGLTPKVESGLRCLGGGDICTLLNLPSPPGRLRSGASLQPHLRCLRVQELEEPNHRSCWVCNLSLHLVTHAFTYSQMCLLIQSITDSSVHI